MDTINQLKKKGYRITKARKDVLNVLESHPLTVQEIHTRLYKNHSFFDLTSVYRSVQLLSHLGILHEIELGDGKKRYELAQDNKHHHHAICDNCGRIEDVLINQEEKILNQVKASSQFLIEKHSLEFFGRCVNCQ